MVVVVVILVIVVVVVAVHVAILVSKTKASIRRLARHAGITKETDRSLRICQFRSKADGLRAFKILQVRRARKHLLKKSSLSKQERCDNQTVCGKRKQRFCILDGRQGTLPLLHDDDDPRINCAGGVMRWGCSAHHLCVDLVWAVYHVIGLHVNRNVL